VLGLIANTTLSAGNSASVHRRASGAVMDTGPAALDTRPSGADSLEPNLTRSGLGRTMTDIAAAPSPPTEVEALAKPLTPIDRIQRRLHAHPALGPLIVLIAATIVFEIINTRFLKAVNVSLMLQQVSVIAALGVAQTLVILTAGIDLSIGAAMILSQLYMAQMAVNHHLAGVVALGLGLLVGLFTGAVNGALVTRLRVPPFIATLGTLSIFTSWGLIYSHGQTTQATSLPHLLAWTVDAVKIGPFNLINGVLVVVGLYIVVAYILGQTRWGRHVYAIGDDVDAARLAGIRNNRVLFSVYAVAGIIIAIAAWVSIGYTGAASPNNAVDANLQSITAVVIGGTSLFGGRGGVIGTLFGALIVVVFNTGLTLASVNDLYQPIAIGLLVIAAVAIDQWIRRVKA
jgi:fructose transport system permease protein